jgi:hypothetical protein
MNNWLWIDGFIARLKIWANIKRITKYSDDDVLSNYVEILFVVLYVYVGVILEL